MRCVAIILTVVVALSVSGLGYAASDSDSDSNSGSNALGGTVLGGLLGAGLGAAVGSASGHAGTGAAIGGGVGALGGLLLSAEKAKKEKEAARYNEQYEASQAPQAAQQPPSDLKVKKRIIKQYDSEGNIISEKEVAN